MYTFQQLLELPFPERHQELIHNQAYWIDLLQTGQISQADASQILYLQDCQHPKTEIVFCLDATGRKRYQQECLICGHGGNDISVKLWKPGDIQKVPPRRHEDYKLLSDEIKEIYRPIILGIRQDDFQAYYWSPEWEERRLRVLRRDHSTCQICGNDAEIVHHLTYAHFKHEFLFELISLCSQCHHDHYHPEKPR